MLSENIYIAGFVSHKLQKSLHCEECCKALYTHNAQDFHALIAVKNKGNLSFPSKDVFTVCILCEKIFREKVVVSDKSHQHSKLSMYSCQAIIIRVLTELQDKTLFPGLLSHMYDSDPVNNHPVLLISAVAETYLEVRYSFAGKEFTARNNAMKLVKSRTAMNKVVLFSGM